MYDIALTYHALFFFIILLCLCSCYFVVIDKYVYHVIVPHKFKHYFIEFIFKATKRRGI